MSPRFIWVEILELHSARDSPQIVVQLALGKSVCDCKSSKQCSLAKPERKAGEELLT